MSASLVRRSSATIAVVLVVLLGSVAPAFAYPPNPCLRSAPVTANR
jgi:hypothetical protein